MMKTFSSNYYILYGSRRKTLIVNISVNKHAPNFLFQPKVDTHMKVETGKAQE